MGTEIVILSLYVISLCNLILFYLKALFFFFKEFETYMRFKNMELFQPESLNDDNIYS